MREVDRELVRRAMATPGLPDEEEEEDFKGYQPPKLSASRLNVKGAGDVSGPLDSDPAPPSAQRAILMVDSRDACALEAGELIDASVFPTKANNSQPETLHAPRPKELCAEIGELVDITDSGKVAPISSTPVALSGVERYIAEDEHATAATEDSKKNSKSGFEGPITMFKSVGVGLQDVAIACAVVKKAEEMDIGVKVEGYDVI
jgi:hypothetical protein